MTIKKSGPDEIVIIYDTRRRYNRLSFVRRDSLQGEHVSDVFKYEANAGDNVKFFSYRFGRHRDGTTYRGILYTHEKLGEPLRFIETKENVDAFMKYLDARKDTGSMKAVRKRFPAYFPQKSPRWAIWNSLSSHP